MHPCASLPSDAGGPQYLPGVLPTDAVPWSWTKQRIETNAVQRPGGNSGVPVPASSLEYFVSHDLEAACASPDCLQGDTFAISVLTPPPPYKLICQHLFSSKASIYLAVCSMPFNPFFFLFPSVLDVVLTPSSSTLPLLTEQPSHD